MDFCSWYSRLQGELEMGNILANIPLQVSKLHVVCRMGGHDQRKCEAKESRAEQNDIDCGFGETKQ
jgi:hypothetical protein